MMPQVYCTFCL